MRNNDFSFDRMFDGLGWNDLFDAGLNDVLPAARRTALDLDSAVVRNEASGVTSAQTSLPPAADIPGSTATTATIASGGLLVGTLETKGDHDWIKITLTAGQHVTLLLSGFGPGGLDDPLVNLRSSTGAVLATNDDIENGVQRDSRLEFTAATSGTYYIDAGAYANDYTGDYVLQVFDSQSTADSILPTRSTTARMEYGGDYNGVIEVGHDHDWIAIDLVAGQEYVVRVTGDGANPLANPILGVRNPNGTIVGQNDNTYGFNPEVSFTASVTGTYYIDVGSSGDVGTGEYSISVTPALQLYTYDQIATQLTETYWGDGQRAFDVGADGVLTYDASTLPANVQTIVRAALQTWSDITGFSFVAQVGGADITFEDTGDGAYANSTLGAGGVILNSTVNVSTEWVARYGTSLDSYTMQTYIHEIGHALGLGHAGDYNGSATYPLDASFENDAWVTTVMSYFSPGENFYFSSLGFTSNYLVTPMNGDVVAITDLYGLSTTTRTTNTVYGFGSNAGAVFNANAYNKVAYCIVDSGGIDWLNYSLFTQNQVITLAAEEFMNIGAQVGNVVIGRGTVIENARGGSGNDTITGNAVGNTILGHAGADTIDGAGGNDVLRGGLGNDAITGGTGNDLLFGEDNDDQLEGSDGNDVLKGGTGSDVLGGSAGADGLYGEDGDDSLFGGTGADRLIGGAGVDFLSGGDDTDYLDGGAGNDVLNGGLGNDILIGGAGADRFRLDAPLSTSNADQIRDFEHLVDKMLLDNAVFTQLGGAGALAESAFRAGVAALDADDRIIYNAATGAIFYDADGVGGAAQVRIANVTAGMVLTHDDFTVVGSGAASEPIKVAAAEPLASADLFGG